jgi:putative AlgH/UPF0301 family transcriptional regulator
MSQRKRILFAVLFTIVALTAVARVKFDKAGFPAPRPNPWFRARGPAASPAPWQASRPAVKPVRSIHAEGTPDEVPAAFSLPIQFKNPKYLGVGRLLVSARGLGDPNFAERVVLIVHYDEGGVVGLVLNQHTDVPLSRVFDLKAAKDRSDTVYLGGPVEPSSVLALFQSPTKPGKAENVFEGVYLISDKTLFEQTISAKPDPDVFHVFLGYAGWTEDQLRNEVQLGAWYIFPADTATVFKSDPKSLWLEMIHKTELQMAETEPVRQPSGWTRAPFGDPLFATHPFDIWMDEEAAALKTDSSYDASALSLRPGFRVGRSTALGR